MMEQALFTTGVGLFMRFEYLTSLHMLKENRPDWSDNKRRLFAVRVVSLTHALVSSILVVISLAINNAYVTQPVEYSSYAAQYVFLWSMGYFIYDLFDMIYHGEASSSKEYLVHHTLVITCFSIIMYTGTLMGFAMIALLVEVQTVLMHSRSLLHLAGYAKTPAFRLLVSANMTCLFLFRHIPITYLIYFLSLRDDKVNIVLKAALVGGLSFIEYHNIHLTAAMYKADGLFGGRVTDLDEDEVDPLGAVKKEAKDKST